MDTIVVGIGNSFRSDDGAGIAVAQMVRNYHLPSVTVLEQSGEGGELIECWKNAQTVFLCDAVAASGHTGAIYRFDSRTDEIPSGLFSYSTHQFSLAEAVAMARIIGAMPQKLIVYGIEGKNFAFGTELTPQVANSANETAKKIVYEIQTAGALQHAG